MVRTLFISIVAFALVVGTACGDDSSNNGGSPNITPGNNMTSGNNDTTNVTTNNANNMTTNNANTGNTTTNPDCIQLNPALEGECDVLCQTGCGASEGCVIAPSPTPDAVAYTSSCVSPGAGTEGTACTDSAECAAGYGCVEARDGSGSACFPYCRAGGPEEPKCDAGLECIGFQLEVRVGTCQPELDGCQLFPDTCGDGEACYYNPDGPRQCAAEGPGDAGDECTENSDCGGELRCVDLGGATTECEFICNASDPDDESFGCPQEQSCVERTDADGNGLGWGICE